MLKFGLELLVDQEERSDTRQHCGQKASHMPHERMRRMIVGAFHSRHVGRVDARTEGSLPVVQGILLAFQVCRPLVQALLFVLGGSNESVVHIADDLHLRLHLILRGASHAEQRAFIAQQAVVSDPVGHRPRLWSTPALRCTG